MDTIHLPPDFKEFLRLLNSHHVEYLLVGGYAVGYYGYPRATADMDIWVAIHEKTSKKILVVLKEFGMKSPELSEELFLKKEQIIRMGIPPFQIEILTSISGVEFDECYEKRVVDLLDGVQVNLISLDHLKANKRASGRYQDLSDLEHLP